MLFLFHGASPLSVVRSQGLGTKGPAHPGRRGLDRPTGAGAVPPPCAGRARGHGSSAISPAPGTARRLASGRGRGGVAPAGGGSEGDDEQPEVRAGVVAGAEHGERLDKVVVALAAEFSRAYLQHLVKSGWVHVEGSAVTSPAQRVRAGQRIAVTLQPTAESRAYRAEALPLVIVHEDDEVLVIDKAAGMVVHPAAGNWSGTVLNALLARDPRSAALPRAGIVHRLDKDTSGLMVVAKTVDSNGARPV